MYFALHSMWSAERKERQALTISLTICKYLLITFHWIHFLSDKPSYLFPWRNLIDDSVLNMLCYIEDSHNSDTMWCSCRPQISSPRIEICLKSWPLTTECLSHIHRYTALLIVSPAAEVYCYYSGLNEIAWRLCWCINP